MLREGKYVNEPMTEGLQMWEVEYLEGGVTKTLRVVVDNPLHAARSTAYDTLTEDGKTVTIVSARESDGPWITEEEVAGMFTGEVEPLGEPDG